VSLLVDVFILLASVVPGFSLLPRGTCINGIFAPLHGKVVNSFSGQEFSRAAWQLGFAADLGQMAPDSGHSQEWL
jgi:hypothetical protein